MIEIYAPNEGVMLSLGAARAACSSSVRVVHLSGELGTGKTVFVRGFLRAVGVTGRVRSPTFTLVETYNTSVGPVYHFALYRLAESEELEFLGVRDFEHEVQASGCLFFEWPERAAGVVPAPELEISFYHTDVDASQRVEQGIGDARLRLSQGDYQLEESDAPDVNIDTARRLFFEARDLKVEEALGSFSGAY